MPAKNHYTLYKGHKLHYPLGHDLLKDRDGRYAVYAVMSKPWSSAIERYVIPGCFASTLREAEQLSIGHAKRLVDEGVPSRAMPPPSLPRRHGNDPHPA